MTYVSGKGADGGIREVLAPGRVAKAYRASGALAGSGTYDDLEWHAIPLGSERVSLAYSYTLGANNTTTGYASVRPQFKSNEIEGLVFRDVDVDSPTVSGATIKKPVRELELPLPTPAAAGGTVADVIVFRVPPGMTHVAFPAAETGDTANPGTLACWVLMGF